MTAETRSAGVPPACRPEAGGPNRIERRFAALRKEGRAGVVIYLTAGDPDPETSFALFSGLAAAGADLIEIGMPFSDPMADGPSIQAAGQRALKAGTTLRSTLAMVRDFQSVIGRETREQLMKAEGRLPDTLVACIGGGSNAMGLFHPFLDEPSVAMIGVEAGGHGIDTGLHAASLNGGLPGVLHGNRAYLLQDADGQIHDAHSISAGLDYPGIGPEHAWLHDLGRVEYVSITDREALEAFQLCSRQEGIIPALEPAHALAHVAKIAPTLPRDHLMVMNMCGRGDKDIFAVADHLGVKL